MKKILLTLVVVFGSLLLAAQAQAQVVVIANPSIKSADVSKNDLRDVFTGGSSSIGGSNATPVLLKAGATSDEFLTVFIGKNDSAFRAGWRSLVFSGQASMPKTVDSETAMVDFVTRNAGAIGYISKATPHEGVKVLAVR
jgi:ABC-type phosphate transport system substrate-binding protein